MHKVFQYDVQAEQERLGQTKVEIELQDQSFELNTDLTGLQVLQAMANPTARGGLLFLERVIKDEDWARFGDATAGMTREQMGEFIGEVIGMYAGFPTQTDDSSSSPTGPTTTGNTSDLPSEPPASIPTPVPSGV